MTWHFTAPIGTEVVSLHDATSGDCVIVKLRSTTPDDLTCPHCGGPRFKNGTRIVRFRDVPTADGRPVLIDWVRQKFICRTCNRSSHDHHSAFDRRRDMTARFVEWVGREAAERGFTAVAEQTSINPKVARRAFRQTEKELGTSFGLLSDAIAIELIDLAGSKRPAIIDAKEEFVFEVYASVQEMRTRLPAFAKEYSRCHEHPIVITDLSFVLKTEGPPLIGDDLFGVQAVRVISRPSLEREVTSQLWNACEPLLHRKYPDGASRVRAFFSRRKGSMKKIARGHLNTWEREEPEVYAAYQLKEDFLKIWQPEAGLSVEGRLDAWMQRIVHHPVLHLAALIDAISKHRDEILACFGYDFLEGFYERLSEIISMDTNRTARSFSAARAALLMRGIAQERIKLAELADALNYIQI